MPLGLCCFGIKKIYLKIITLKFSEDTLFRYLSIFNLYVEYGERFFLNLLDFS